MVKVRLSFLIILIGLLSLPGIVWSAVDEQSIAFDQKTDAIKVLAFGRPVLPTGAGPADTNPASDVIEPALDPRGDVGVGPVNVSPVTSFVLTGDYNRNGVVDAADYVLWRKTLTQPVTPGSGADGNNNGVVDTPDYGVWTGNFGESNP